MMKKIVIYWMLMFVGFGVKAQIIQDFRLNNSSAFKYHFTPDAKLVAISSAFIGYGFMTLGNGELQELNMHTRNEIMEDHPRFSTKIDNYLQFSPAMTTFALKMSGIKGEHDNLQSVRLYLTSTVLMAGTVYTLKHLTKELRPDGSAYTSFPSGHTATAFAAAEFMHQEFKNTSPILSYSGYLAASATGALRMYNNKHYLSDVIAGAGIGILTTKAAYWIDKKLFKK